MKESKEIIINTINFSTEEDNQLALLLLKRSYEVSFRKCNDKPFLVARKPEDPPKLSGAVSHEEDY